MWPGVQTVPARAQGPLHTRRTALRLAGAGGHTAGHLYRQFYRGLALPGAARGEAAGASPGCWSPLPLLPAAAHCHMWHKAGAAATTPAALMGLHWPPSIGHSRPLRLFSGIFSAQERLPHSSGSKLERLGLIDRGVLSLSTPGIWSGCQMKPN